MTSSKPFNIVDAGSENSKVQLTSPCLMPKAAGFLWNKKMMIQMNCRGYAVAQFMQPEPAKYAYAPNIEAKTFMQPEHHYYSDHPGRFFYIKDEDSGELFSAPYEPVREPLDNYKFIVSDSDIAWQIEHLGLIIDINLTLTTDEALEIWSFKVTNISGHTRNVSIYPYFPIGYMSWMNQSADYNINLNAIVATAITPYQKVEQYFEHKTLKDKTYFLSDKAPTSWLANQNMFAGEGGLTCPDEITQTHLSNKGACYEVPTAVFQYQLTLENNESFDVNFLFGPAQNEQEISALKEKYFKDAATLATTKNAYFNYLAKSKACLTISTDDKYFDDMINHWLPRQMFYHGDVNRLTTDPQTRNYVQDNMGMVYLNPSLARSSILTTLSQQRKNGSMPDGILLHPDARLKYINEVPHADHCVWLPICLVAYLNETNDGYLLKERLPFVDASETASVVEHIDLAIEYLLKARDKRGLSYIEQGDWCDPMNMVGYKGKGVSAWLSLATVYAINCWVDIRQHYVINSNPQKTEYYRLEAKNIITAIQTYLWDGKWFARGITDDGVTFGIQEDKEGRIYLNSQSWAILSGTASAKQKQSMLEQIAEQLITPYGVMMLAPSYTKMREDVGRLTQKSPGVSENGSVYNHAGVFYAYSLYQAGEAQQAFDILHAMIPSPDDAEKRGQLPVFIPNYYRGAYFQHPEQAGKSSQLFNTGTIAWFYRCIVEELCGLKGNNGELTISPQLPKEFKQISGTRIYQHAKFDFIIKKSSVKNIRVSIDGELLSGNIITNIHPGKSYLLSVDIPEHL